MKTLDDNNKNWQKLDIVLRKRQKSTVIWITCDNYPYRQALIKEFINRFNEFEHIKLSLAEFGEKSFIDFFKENLPAQAFDGGKYVVHLTDIETVLLPHLKAEKSKEHFLVMLNFEREILFSFPFFIVFWSTTYAQIAVQQLATDFWDWLTYKFHFTAPEQISQKPELQQIEYKEFIPEEEKGRIYDRIQHNLYALKTIEKERISDRLTLFKSIISDYLKLNEPEKAKLVFEEAIKLKNIPPEQQAELYLLGAEILNELGDYDKAIELNIKALEIYGKIANKKGEATALNNIGEIYKARGDYETALKYLEQSLEIRRQIGDKAGEGATLNNIAALYHARGDYDTALKYLEQSLEIRRQIGDKSGEGATLNNIGQIYLARGDYDTALKYLQRSLEIQRQIGDKSDEGATLNNIGQIYLARGNYDTALKYLEQSLEILRQIGDKAGEAYTLFNIGMTYLANLNQPEKGLILILEAYKINQQVNDYRLAQAIENLFKQLGIPPEILQQLLK